MAGKSITELPEATELVDEDLILISRKHDTGNAALSRAVKAQTIREMVSDDYVRLVNDEDVSGVKNFKDGIKIGSAYKMQADGTLVIANAEQCYVKAEDGKIKIGSNTSIGDPVVRAYAPPPTSTNDNQVATTTWVHNNYAVKNHVHGFADLSGTAGFALIGNLSGTYEAEDGCYIDGISVGADSTLSVHQSQFKKADVLKIETVIDMIYPVGAVYIGIQDICPLSYIHGTWQKISSGKCLQTAEGGQAGQYIDQGLPAISSNRVDINGTTSSAGSHAHSYSIGVGNCECGKNGGNLPRSTHISTGTPIGSTDAGGQHTHTFSATVNLQFNNSIYGRTKNVQPPAFAVNVWKRIA